MLRLMTKISFLFVLLVSLTFAGNVSATPIPIVIGENDSFTLSYINDNGGVVQIGDKWFYDITVGAGIDPNSVYIQGHVDGNVDNIIFNSGSFYTSSGVLDIPLTYVVESHGTPIYMIDQYFNLTHPGTGGEVSIGETVFDGEPGNGGTQVAQSDISFFLGNEDLSDPDAEVGDDLYIDPALLTLWVTKDIRLESFEGGAVGATIIGQSFHQTSVPEPGILLLLGTGFAGLAFYARRKRK